MSRNGEMAVEFQKVTMKAVPAAHQRPPGICRRLYGELLAIDQKRAARALQVPCGSLERLYYIQNQLRALARRDGRELGSRRNAEGTVAWFWLLPRPLESDQAVSASRVPVTASPRDVTQAEAEAEAEAEASVPTEITAETTTEFLALRR